MEIVTVYKSPLDMLYHWEQTCPDKIYLQQPLQDAIKTWTWKQAAEEVRRMAAALKAMQFPPQSKIALLSKNCAHWILSDLSIMMAGHVSVPLYPNITSSTVSYILKHSDAVLLFIGKLDDWLSMKSGVPEEMKCISFPLYGPSGYENWNELLEKFTPLKVNIKREPEEAGTILYTSGTTGVPKGVLHQFNTFSFTALNGIAFLGFGSHSRFFSYLPLSHSAERSFVEMGSLYCGGEIYFSASVQQFSKNLSEAKPTEFLAVHLIWKKIQERILEKISQRKLNMYLRLPFISQWVKKKIRKEMGLQCAVNIIAGASPMPVDLIAWFATVGIYIQEGYGLTENWSYSHVNKNDHIKPGMVGPPLPGVEVKLDENGEILVRHAGLMKEYFKEADKTADAFTADGFLKTGDSGSIDVDGFLKITGRVKDIFKTSKGNYVSPSPIETKISGNENVDFACVVGNLLPQPMALIILSNHGLHMSKEKLTAELKNLFDSLNATLDVYERVKKFVVLNDTWDIKNGFLTPTFKVKRNEVEMKYASRYQEWEQEDGFLIFD